MTVCFVSNYTKLTIFACYTPTNEADDDEKNNFYKMLQAVTKDVPSHDLKSVVGDLSAKVGADRQYCPEVLGCHSIGEMNETSVLLVDYVLSNDLVIGGTLFEHKKIYKYTWMSPDSQTKNQIETSLYQDV